jgi:hypothetical protein
VTSKRLQSKLLFARLSAFCLLTVLFSPHLLPAAFAIPASKLKPSDPYALIFGTVWGPDDRPVYGVRVKIRRASDKKPKWEVYSDHAGEFAQRVPAGEGDYVVWADLKGVKTTDGQTLHLAQEVRIHVEYDERVDMSLHLTP